MGRTLLTSGDGSLPIVILSTADINAAIWTNKQHIAVRLAIEREVHYIESIGLRAPRFSVNDIRRLLARFRGRTPATSVRDAMLRHEGVAKLKVHSPRLLPFHAYRGVRWLNQLLVDCHLRRALPNRYILWTFSPITYGLELNAYMTVYHSVDLLHTIDGIPKEALLAAERRLIAVSDAVVASSKGVADHVREQAGNPLLWENVADIDLFRSARSSQREQRAIFVGNLTPSKVDFGLLEAIVASGVRIALAGPISIDGTRGDATLTRLLRSSMVEYLGVLSQGEMAVELGRSRIGLIPYHVNEYTAGVFPMKVYEYLSAGLPVVSTNIPSIADNAISGVIVCGREAFAAQVAVLCKADYSEPNEDLAANSWNARIEQINDLLADAPEHITS